MSTFPARLHVLLARESPLAVVIRRGPSKHVCTVGWDRETDTFAVGQWLKGRIYERRSDLSPDGRHFIYFAMNGKWESETRGSWTAISRAPYLKAIGLWGKGDGWNGGGLFLSDQKFWLNDGYGHRVLKKPSGLKWKKVFPFDEDWGGECPGVYYHRLQRDGWAHVSSEETGDENSIDCFKKQVDDQWVLWKRAHRTLDHPDGKGCYYDEHELIHSSTGKTIKCQDWEWAELDGPRLVWASHGKLFAGILDPVCIRDVTELYDFNSMQFEVIEAPY